LADERTAALLSECARRTPPLTTYTTADGLPHNVINKIVRDSRGFLWFCTEEGLSRFDGYGFTNYGTSEGLPHPGVNDILETRGGEYWVATDGGLVRFNPRGVPASRIVYANEAPANAPPMFAVVVPEDTDRHYSFRIRIKSLRESERALTTKQDYYLSTTGLESSERLWRLLTMARDASGL
jgi:hypothetical protein